MFRSGFSYSPIGKYLSDKLERGSCGLFVFPRIEGLRSVRRVLM